MNVKKSTKLVRRVDLQLFLVWVVLNANQYFKYTLMKHGNGYRRL